jgi:hypothetical protein
VLALVVLSHWVLDVISHRPDVPLAPGSHHYFGLGLWNSVPATLLVEIALFAAGVFLYTKTTRPRDGVGRWAWWGLVALLTVTYLGNAFGPPPPDTRWLVWVGMSQWLLVACGYWVDRHRAAVAA